MTIRPIIGTLALGLALGQAGLAGAASYTFTRIADTSDPFTQFAPPALNDSGVVAFFAERGADNGGIFAGSGGAITTIADGSDDLRTGFGGIGQTPAINGAGTVALEAIPVFGGDAIFLGSGGPLTRLLYTDSSTPFLLLGSPAINGAGTVAFRGFLKTGSVQGIYASDGTTTTTIADRTGPLSAFGDFVSINDSGTVAFEASFDAGGSGIFAGSGGALTTIADTTGMFASFNPSALINAAGTVAFQATLDAGGTGAYFGSGGALTTIADTSGPFSLVGVPLINDSGMIAFGALLDGGGLGLFTGPDPVADRIIGTGDALDGSTVTDLNYFLYGLNNHGSLAFTATLADGRQGVYVASIAATAVPEPASLAMATGGLLGVLALARRRGRRA